MKRIPGLLTCILLLTLALAELVLAPRLLDLPLARAKRASYGFGTALSPTKPLADPQRNDLSDHDLFMLVEAARFQIGRDDALSRARAAGRLPVLYRYLDGFQQDVIVLKRAIRDDLPRLGVPDLAGGHQTWAVAPVLLDGAHAPSVRDAVCEVLADDPLASINTCGQVTTPAVRVWGARYALTDVREDPLVREREASEVSARVSEIAEEAAAGADSDYTFVRRAFDLIASQASYQDDAGASIHYNDAYGALVEGKARCYGLAGALKLVLDRRGIPNYLADGTKPDGRHTWNVLYLNGTWRACDLTLAVGGAAEAARTETSDNIRGCLVAEASYRTRHLCVPDAKCRALERVYGKLVGE